LIVYIESNFVLEAALLQEEQDSCARILEMCKAGMARLTVPAFSLAEPFETSTRRHRERIELYHRLRRELAQLLRSQPYKSGAKNWSEITSLLMKSTEEEKGRLSDVVRDIVQIADVIPLTGEIVAAALRYQADDFSLQDATIYASILSHLRATAPSQSCFLNKNRKDFSSPEKVAELRANGCRLIYTFRDGVQFLESQRA
jgi:predicted nucleic acid-binding protein